jgi:hypothetical protein
VDSCQQQQHTLQCVYSTSLRFLIWVTCDTMDGMCWCNLHTLFVTCLLMHCRELQVLGRSFEVQCNANHWCSSALQGICCYQRRVHSSEQHLWDQHFYISTESGLYIMPIVSYTILRAHSLSMLCAWRHRCIAKQTAQMVVVSSASPMFLKYSNRESATRCDWLYCAKRIRGCKLLLHTPSVATTFGTTYSTLLNILFSLSTAIYMRWLHCVCSQAKPPTV